MDFSPIVGSVDFGGLSLVLLGVAAVVAAVLVFEVGARKVLALVGGDGDGHTAATIYHDESPTALDAVYARAAAMAAAGAGQSDDFRHNTVTAAYDAGYSGRHLGDSVDPATLRAWEDGRDARHEDEIRYGDR